MTKKEEKKIYYEALLNHLWLLHTKNNVDMFSLSIDIDNITQEIEEDNIIDGVLRLCKTGK